MYYKNLGACYRRKKAIQHRHHWEVWRGHIERKGREGKFSRKW